MTTPHALHPRYRDLQRAKLQALALLGVALFGFFVSLYLARTLPAHWAIGALRAACEAAMVGGLADWFAIWMLFKRVVPNNQAAIARNLAAFIKERFFGQASLTELLRSHDPVKRFAQWLSSPANSQRLSLVVKHLLIRWIDFIDERAVQQFALRALHQGLNQIDLSSTLGKSLDVLTKDGRHQAILDQVLRQCGQLLLQPSTQTAIAGEIVEWFKREHATLERVLPTPWLNDLSTQGAKLSIEALGSMLRHVADSPNHVMRQRYNQFLQEFIQRLQDDPQWIERGEAVREQLKHNPKLTEYINGLWSTLRTWLKRDLADAKSRTQEQVDLLSQWLGKALQDDPQFKSTLDEHLREGAQQLAPHISDFLAHHIRNTIEQWDKTEMIQQIELNIGKDLHKIRFNGTLIGGVLGLVLFAIAQAFQTF